MIVSSGSNANTPPVPAIGTGPLAVMMTQEQVELIAALVYQCRLGMGTIYSTAAFQLSETIENAFGSDFMEDASNAVNLQVIMEDGTGSIVFSSKSGTYYPTFEI